MASPAERLRSAADGLAPLVRSGLLDYHEAHNSLERAAIDHGDEMAVYAVTCLGEAMMRPDLLAARDIRAAIGPLMSARKPRDTVLLAAYRAANGRLQSAEIETIVRQEMSAYVARVRGIAAR